MARGKKTEEILTPEERLAEALVPVEEQPYPVPENWCWVRMGYLVNVINGFAFKSELYEDKGIRIIRITNVQDGYIEDEKPVFYPLSLQGEIAKYLLYEGDLLLSLTGNVGRTAILTSDMLPAALNQRVACIRCNNHDINKRFLFYFFLRKQFQDDCINNSKGSAQLNMSTEWLKKQPLCVPPFAEQQRMVDCIERLFVKLDEAKEKAQAVMDSFETRKAAILHKAFTGELTEKWRKKNNMGLNSWENRTLESVCTSIFDGDHMPPPKSDSGVSFLVISNVNTGHLSYENTRYVPKDYYDSLSDTRKPELGDVLYTLVGSYGIPIVVDDERPFCFQRHMALLKLKDLNTYFMWYLLQSQEMYNKVSSIATGTAQLTVPIKGLRKIEFMKPNNEEQAEIVRILDNLFVKEQQAKEAAEAVLDQIETMKKTILAHAFRGELGTNDSAEESAVELLKFTL